MAGISRDPIAPGRRSGHWAKRTGIHTVLLSAELVRVAQTKSRSPFGLRLSTGLRAPDQAALAFVCCNRWTSLVLMICPPTLQFPSFTSSIFTCV